MMSFVMKKMRHRPTHPLMVLALTVLTVFALVPNEALADRAFARRFSTNVEGDLVLVGNTLLTCPTGAANCAAAQAGGAFNNNDFNPMAFVDMDGDTTTFNSSEAGLVLPPGSTVKFAGLYWSGDSADVARGQVLFKTPTSFGYSVVNASVVDQGNNSPVPSSAYQGFADVTAQVVAGGAGNYRVANVQASTAQYRHAGWSLIVVFANNSYPLRNFAVYDGIVYANAQTISIPVSGFLTPLSGPISTRLGTVVYDGDVGTNNDTIALNGTLLSDAVHPANNSYNSTIADGGAYVTNKNPNYQNQLGMDIARWNVPPGIMSNGATSATIAVTSPTGGATPEVMWVGVVTFATDIYVPIITPNVLKTAEDVNGGYLLAGDRLRWKVTLDNSGIDTGTNVIATDNIPAGLSYNPNTLEILTGANFGTKSDSAANDQAEYIASGTPRVVFRLGAGANGTMGGNLPYLAGTSFWFETIVAAGLPAGTVLSNSVGLTYSGQTIGSTFTATSAAATMTLVAPPTLSKSFTPNLITVNSASVLTVVMTNPAGNPGNITGVSFSDTYPTDLVNAATPNPQISCTAGSTAGTLTGGVAGGNTIGLSPGATLVPGGSCTITVNVTSAIAGNYTNTTSVVSSTNAGNGNAASALITVGKPSITKAFSPTTILAGATSTITFTINNGLPTALSNVAFSDALTNMVVATPNGVGGTCTGTKTAVAGSASIALSGGALAANGSCTFIVNVTSSTTGILPNTTTGVSSTESGGAGAPSNTANLTVVSPPVLSKTFSPTSVRTNVASTLTLVVSNPNPTTTITGVAFSDTYPTNLVNDTPANRTLNCTAGSTGTATGGANAGTTVGFTAGSLLPGGSCTLTVNVESALTGNYANSTSTVTSSNTNAGALASATLNVTALVAPTVTKAFSVATIPVGGTATQTITLNNTLNLLTAVTGVAFTDTLPSGLTLASVPSTTCASGVVTGTIGGTVLGLSGATIAAAGSCTVTVTVTSVSTAQYVNSTGTVTSANAGTFGPATGTLEVLAPPAITKTMNPAAIGVAPAFSTLTIALSNTTTATTSLTGVEIGDVFPTNLVVAATPTPTNSCGGGVGGGANSLQGRTGVGAWGAVAAGNTEIRLQGQTLAPNASCSVTLRVSSATPGTYLNTTNAVLSTNGGTGTTASATVSVARPSIAKAFSVSPIAAGATTVLTLTLTNPTGTAMTAAAFTDTYPAGMTNTGTPSGATTCAGGSVTAAANGGSVALAGGTIPANGSCTVTVNVTSTITVTNTVPAGGLTALSGVTPVSNGVPASAPLAVYARPAATKTFSAPTILPAGTVTLSIVIANGNALAGTSLGFTDTFPAGMTVAATPNVVSTCGTVQGRTGVGAWGAVVSGNTEIRINNNGSLPANSACSVLVDVTSSTVGAALNSTGPISTANIGTGIASTATVVVMGPPTVAKSFSPNSALTNAVSILTITLTNPNSVAITGAAFTDTYPSVNLVNDATPSGSTSCVGGTVTAAAAGNSVALSGATIPANGSCLISVRVKSAVAAVYTNNTGAVTTSNAGSGTSASGIFTVTQPMANLDLLKLVSVFSDPYNAGVNPKSIPGAISAYTLRATNTGPGTTDLDTVLVTDPLPAEVEMYVGDIGGGGSGPVVFTNGAPTSGLSWVFSGLAVEGDSIDFSLFNSGTDFTYHPTADANGFDALVRRIRLNPKGVMNAVGGGNPFVDMQFRVRIK